MIRLNCRKDMIFRKFPIFFFFILALMHFSLSGQVINMSQSSSKSEWPAVAVNSAGEIMVVWTEWGAPGQMYYRIYRKGQWSGRTNSDIVSQWAWSNQLEVDSVGMFHISFADGYGSTGRDIYYSFYNGSTWASSQRIYHSPHNSAWNKMAIDSNNDIHIIWYHKYLNSPDISDVVTMHKNKGGQWPSSYENISRRSSLESIHPAIRARSGHTYATYMEGASGGWKLYFSEKSGGGWSSPNAIVSLGYYPAMALDGMTNVHIAYSNRSGNFFCISREGGTWGSPQVISNGYAPLQFGDIRCISNNIVAGWTQERNGAWSVYIANKITGGQWAPPVKVSPEDTLGDGNKHVQLAVDNQGYAHVVWEAEGVGGKEDIFYTKVLLADPGVPFIEVDKTFLTFDMEEGESPDPQTFKIKSYGGDALDYTISSDKPWLIVSPQSGTATEEWDTINVVVDAENFQAGKRNGTITITAPDAYNNPVKISVSLTIEKKKSPYIQLNRSSFYFFAFARGDNPDSQTFRIRNSGAQTLNYQISSNKSWLKVSPAQGSSTGEWDTITVSADVSSLGIDKHKGVIKITASGAENSPQSINVEFEVVLPPYPYPPTSVQLRRIDHEGLMVKNYISRIDWQENSKNDGLFNIVNYRIFRKKNSEPGSAYIFLDEVGSNVFNYYDHGFSSKSERDKYCYAVTCIDDAGRESLKAETSGFGSVLTFVSSERKALKERNSSTVKKH